MSADDLKEESMIPISALQHFAFCRRQWALIHLEQQWCDNVRTVEGKILHRRADDPQQTEQRGNMLIVRAFHVSSERLGINGICDVVEFHKDPLGIELYGRKGRWLPRPVEYKRGEPKEGDEDLVQLCAQALCLEDTLLCKVEQGTLFYGETRRRMDVTITPELRERVESIIREIRFYTSRDYTPEPGRSSKCRSCSLQDLCLPRMKQYENVGNYIHKHIGSDK